MTAPELEALRDYRRARADYARTARQPHSLSHMAALIVCERAATTLMAARMVARSAKADSVQS
jgi:hypothetical protein